MMETGRRLLDVMVEHKEMLSWLFLFSLQTKLEWRKGWEFEEKGWDVK